MLRMHIVLFTVFLLCQEGISRSRTRVVNGNKAKLGDFPYQVSLQRYGDMYCGGSIIGEYHVLTAAHCVEGRTHESWNVIVGSINLNRFEYPAQNHSVVDFHIHEKYVWGNGFKNDLALLKLGTPIVFNEYVKPAKLPKPHEDVASGKVATISGYGRTDNWAELSPILYYTKLFIESRETCQKSYSMDKIRKSHLCTRHPTKVTGFCRGDSGGPLTIDGKVVGVVSFALDNACATRNKYPQVYVRVSEFINWINEHLEK